MIINHVSDTHGTFPLAKDRCDVVVHSGDWAPNYNHGPPVASHEAKMQEQWVRENIEKFKIWLDDTPLIVVNGNHDFCNLANILNEYDIEAYDVNDKVTRIKNWTFTGFPYVPFDCKPWNYSLEAQAMEFKVEDLKDRIEIYGVDIVVSHCPPYGVFDMGYLSQRFGNGPMARMLDNGLSPHPKAWLCGHIHGDHGVTYEWDMIISNAACRVNRIEVR